MPSKFELGTYFGLRFSASRNVLPSMAVLWAIIAAGAVALLKIPLIEAIVGGLVCAVAHVLLEILHQFGHAAAARSTGHPMSGVHLWLVLGRSMYPSSEGELPGRVHVRRALGGPLGSFIVGIILAVVALALRPWDVTPGWIAAFLFLDNLLVFILGAFLPLGFTDGSTLLKWWGKIAYSTRVPRARPAAGLTSAHRGIL